MSQLHYLSPPESMLPGTLAGLLQHVAQGGDFYAAVALYPFASPAQREQLAACMFATRRDVLMLARWEHTPAAVLDALSRLPHMPVAARVLRHRNTAGETLSQHYRPQEDPALPGLLAQHPHAPGALLQRLAAEEQDHAVLKTLARNPAAGAEALLCLHQRFPGLFSKELAIHPATPAALLAELFQERDRAVQVAVVGNPHCPEACLRKAAQSHHHSLLRAVAKHPALTVERMARLVMHPDNAVRAAIATHAAMPAINVLRLVQDASAAVRRAVATRPDLAHDSMWLLACDADVWVRQWLARNPAVARDVLNKLALDIDEDVRRAVARNPACPMTLLKRLANDASAWVRAAVAYQPRATGTMLARLAANAANDGLSHGVSDVLAGVASNAHTPPSILRRLVMSADAEVRRGVILNPEASRATLLPLLEDPYYLHRLMLVSCASLTRQDKWVLRDDPDHRVRFALYQWLGSQMCSVAQPCQS